jgi:hypothetical protein
MILLKGAHNTTTVRKGSVGILSVKAGGTYNNHLSKFKFEMFGLAPSYLLVQVLLQMCLRR